jgi:hypothetical protein
MLFPPQIQVELAFTMQDAISIIYGLSLNLCFLVHENDKLFFLSCFKKIHVIVMLLYLVICFWHACSYN